MKISFDTCAAAVNNSPEAQLREATRMLLVAWCVRQLGHQVSVKTRPAIQQSPIFQELFPNETWSPGQVDTAVCAAEQLDRPKNCRLAIGWKTSENVDRDSSALNLFDLLVAHEYRPTPRLPSNMLNVPLGLHQVVLEEIQRHGLIQPFLRNELDCLRKRYVSQSSIDKAVFVGADAYGRKGLLERLKTANPQRFVAYWNPCQPGTDYQAYLAAMRPQHEYLNLLGKYRAGLHLPGNTPKTTRFSELVVLGRAVVIVPDSMTEDPPVDHENAIVLDNYDDGTTCHARWTQIDGIVATASQQWIDFWSPMGQAQRLITRLP